MASKTEQRKIEIIANGKKFNASFKEMSASARILENQLKKMPRHTKEWAAKSKELKTVKKNLNAMRTEMRGTQGAMSKISGLFSPMMLGFAGVALAIRGVFNTIKDFQQGASDLAAVLGETREEVSDLTDDAKRLGAQTAFTATEVTGLQTEYAKLGFSKNEIIGVTEATLELAAATGSDLAQSAAVAGGTLRAFNLDVSQSQRVVDVMAKSFSSSALDMEKFTTAMGVVGPVGASAGQSIEQVTAKLGVLVNRNIDASTAGTGLRNIFLDLADKGLSWEEAMGMINSAADKNAVALELFGKRGATVATVLAENAEATGELEGKLNDAAGAAETMANTKLNTLQGRITLLTSAWDGFILSIEDGDGVIGSFVSGTLEFFTNALRDLSMISNIFELAFNDISEVSEETLDMLLQFGETDAGNKVADVLKTAFEGVTNKEFVDNIARSRKTFIDAMVAEGETAEDSLVLFNRYFQQRVEGYANDLQVYQDALKAREDAEKKAAAAQAERERVRQEEKAIADRAERDKKFEEFEKGLEEDKKKEKTKIKAEKTALDARLAQYKDFNDKKLKELDEAEQKELDKLTDWEKIKQDTLQGLKEIGWDATQQINAAAFANLAQQRAFAYDEERNRVAEQYDTEVLLLREKLDKGQITEEEFAAQKKALEKQQAEDLYNIKVAQFKADKKAAIGKIAIDTAIAVAKAIASSPQTFGLPWSAFATAQGVVQAAVVGLQKPPPRPQFATGGLTDVGTFKYGGHITQPSVGEIGEAGAEWVGPNWMLQSPMFADIFSYLEGERVRGTRQFASGGSTGSATSSGQSGSILSDEMKALRGDVQRLTAVVASWPTRLQVHNNVQDTADKLQVLNDIENDSVIMRLDS